MEKDVKQTANEQKKNSIELVKRQTAAQQSSIITLNENQVCV